MCRPSSADTDDATKCKYETDTICVQHKSTVCTQVAFGPVNNYNYVTLLCIDYMKVKMHASKSLVVQLCPRPHRKNIQHFHTAAGSFWRGELLCGGSEGRRKKKPNTNLKAKS